MEDQLAFIQYQLWAVIALFLILVGSNVVCYVTRKIDSPPEDKKFPDMWEKDQLDELIIESEKYLAKYPNNVNALYYGAKALVAKNRGDEAREKLQKLSTIEPRLANNMQDMIDDIDNESTD